MTCLINGDKMTINQELFTIFEDKIKPHIFINQENKCWEWTRSLSGGYGQFHPNGFLGKNKSVHRFVYKVFNGEITKEEVVRHTCHNRRCCNPQHLLKGTSKDNWWDSEEKHRTARKKLRKRTGWNVNGKRYPTCRIACEITGLPMNTLIKYTDSDGVFNLKEYREVCKSMGYTPKL